MTYTVTYILVNHDLFSRHFTEEQKMREFTQQLDDDPQVAVYTTRVSNKELLC